MARALFIDDSITTCECCGKTGLKATVAMLLEDDSLAHYGRTCAARNTGKSGQEITREVRAERDRRHGQATNELLRLRRYGVAITQDVVRSVASRFKADATILLRQW
jgi:hypothetical protein